jgi:hypothetical protein
MARLDWTTFLGAHPEAHLVSAHVPEPSAMVLKRLRRLMQALIEEQDPAADYATAIVRRRDITEIQCGFAERGDAERVGARLGAKSVPASEGWMSECRLRIDRRTESALEPSKRASRPAAPDHAHLARSE